MPDVNPEIMAWARRTAGLDVATASSKLGIRSARGLSAEQRLDALEEGSEVPTRAMLAKMARVYRRPLVAFYMSGPPRTGERGRDFRRVTEATESDEAILDALLRMLYARQAIVRAALEYAEEDDSLPFIASMSIDNGLEAVIQSIEEVIQIDVAAMRAAPGPREAFKLLRSAVENCGIFVVLQGDLGSHHSGIGTEVFRGFALADDVAPFVLINANDSPRAWSFTLLHEVTHLWLGQSGVSGGWSDRRLEVFCNDVASRVLLPPAELAENRDALSGDADVALTAIVDFADQRNLSADLVAYRLHRDGFISVSKWRALREMLVERRAMQRAARREANRESEGGPSFYTLRKFRSGQALIEAVGRMLRSGVLTPTKAAIALGVKPRQVSSLLTEVF